MLVEYIRYFLNIVIANCFFQFYINFFIIHLLSL